MQNANVFPSMVLQMSAIGEESGSLDQIRRVMAMVAEDCEIDATKYEGALFTGANVAQQLGEIRAQIKACARGISDLANVVEGKRNDRLPS